MNRIELLIEQGIITHQDVEEYIKSYKEDQDAFDAHVLGIDNSVPEDI